MLRCFRSPLAHLCDWNLDNSLGKIFGTEVQMFAGSGDKDDITFEPNFDLPTDIYVYIRITPSNPPLPSAPGLIFLAFVTHAQK